MGLIGLIVLCLNIRCHVFRFHFCKLNIVEIRAVVATNNKQIRIIGHRCMVESNRGKAGSGGPDADGAIIIDQRKLKKDFPVIF